MSSRHHHLDDRFARWGLGFATAATRCLLWATADDGAGACAARFPANADGPAEAAGAATGREADSARAAVC